MDGGHTRRRLGVIVLTVCALSAAGVLSAAGLAGCTGDDPSPGVSPTISSAPPATSSPPSPTATPPTAPKAEPTPKSAEAFVKYFWDVYNYSYSTLDPEILRAVSSSTCDFCFGAIDEIEASKEKGLTNEGGRVTPRVIVAPPGKIKTSIVVSSVLRQEASRVRGANNEILSTAEAKPALAAKTRLEWKFGRWSTLAVNVARPKGQP